MPSKNSLKDYVANSYYHVYNRGVEKRVIFKDDMDYRVFLSYLQRHLDIAATEDARSRPYKVYSEAELLTYCLMPNHFHLLLYLKNDPHQLTKLLQSVCTAYTMYFNRQYKRVGHLFQGRFRAVRTTSDTYLQHISRYIHLNPTAYDTWPWSSLDLYLGGETKSWVNPDRILSNFDGDYKKFIEDYVEMRAFKDGISKDSPW